MSAIEAEPSWRGPVATILVGIATAIVNTGIFLGAGILQPLVGWALDRGRAADPQAPWDHALPILAGAAALGALSAWLGRGPLPAPR